MKKYKITIGILLLLVILFIVDKYPVYTISVREIQSIDLYHYQDDDIPIKVPIKLEEGIDLINRLKSTSGRNYTPVKEMFILTRPVIKITYLDGSDIYIDDQHGVLSIYGSKTKSRYIRSSDRYLKMIWELVR